MSQTCLNMQKLLKKEVFIMNEEFGQEDYGEPDGSNATLTSPISQDGRPENSRRYLIPARQGRAVRLNQGQHLTIINTYGTQVCDMWSFYAHSPREFLSMEHVWPWINRLTPV